MIRFKQPADDPALKKLWQVCFGDDPTYIDYFFEEMSQSDCLLWEQNNQIVSMFFVLNCTLQHLKGGYVFAACTLPDSQSKGIMSKMLEEAVQFYQTKKEFLCLVPANTHLFSYYQRNGFEPYFYHTVEQISNRPSFQRYTPLTFAEFRRMRARFPSVVKWGERELAFLFEENLHNGGKNIKTPSGYVLLREEQQTNHCEVLEWLSDDYSEEELFPLTACTTISARKPASDTNTPNGMIRFLTKDAQAILSHKELPLLSLVLD